MSSLGDGGGPDEASWFGPAGTVTGIGSLPETVPAAALELVATYAPHLPFCPQPPVPDLLADTLDQHLEHVAQTSDRWLEHFVRAFASGAFPRAMAVKSQVTGPITLAGLLGARGRGVLWPELVLSLAEHVARRAVHHVHRLRTLGLPVLVVIDEPALVLVDARQGDQTRALLNGVFRRIRHAGARAGLHCCATTCPTWLSSYGPDVVSFDASAGGRLDAAGAPVLGDPHRFFAFGLIRASSVPEAPASAFTRWLTAASMMGDPPALAARTIVTARCGFGRCTLAEAEATFRAVHDVAALIHRCTGSEHDPTVRAAS